MSFSKEIERPRTPAGRGTRVAAVSSSKQHIKEHRAFKVIVIGSSGVGKTCLSCLFTDGVCPESPEATIGVDFREKKVLVEKEIVKLQLWDTAGQERFRQSMTNRYYRDAHAMVIVYDITNMASFRHCQVWLEEARRMTDSGVRVCALVANKSDEEDKRVVSTRMGMKFSEANGMMFFEASTKTEAAKDNIKQIFFTIAARLTERRSALDESICVRADDAAFSLLPHGGTETRDCARLQSSGPSSQRSSSSMSSYSSGRSGEARVPRDRVVSGSPDIVPPLETGRCCKTS